jgi:hypothetical protein
MYGTNPKTGKPIRILKTNTTIWRNRKTVVWVNEATSSRHLDRHDTVCVGLPEYQAALQKEIHIDALILNQVTRDAVEFVKAKQLHQTMLLFITRGIAAAIGEKEFLALRLANVVCLEEIHQVFPFVGKDLPWNGSVEDAVTLVALILRATRVLGVAPDKLSSDRKAHLDSTGIAFEAYETPQIPQLWFLTQFYRPDKARREREIKRCLEENVKCSFIDKIVLLNEKDFSSSFPSDPKKKIEQVVIGKRLTYALVLQWFQANAPPNTICVFANSDIYLDSSARHLWSMDLQDRFLTLLRWDVQEDGSPAKLFGPRPDSQDTWIFWSDSLKARTFNWADLDFPFGKAGCDNAINVEMLRKKFLIVNPAYSIKTYHVHSSAIRTYDPTDVVDKPMYFYAEPTGIHDMEPIEDLKSYISNTVTSRQFHRKLEGASERALDTYCTMVAKQEVFPYTRTSLNTFEGSPIQLQRFSNVFHTSQGLVYDTRRIYVGKTETMQKAWSDAKVSPLVPAFHAKKTLCVHLPNETLQTAESFLLDYISRILLLRKLEGPGEFWAPQNERLMDALQIFYWGEQREVSVLPITPNAQVWADEVVQWAPAEQELLRAEQIDCLRASLQTPWIKSASVEGKPRYVVMVNDFCSAEWVNELEAQLPHVDIQCLFVGRTSPSRCVERLLGAQGIFFYGGPKSQERWGWNWLLPLGANVIEIQNEMEPDGFAAHMSGAAGLRHMIVSVPRAKPEFQRKESIRQIVELLGSKAQDVKPNLPILYMPRKSLTGFFAHPGDSFREMAQLWADAGLVTLVEHPSATQIWLNEIGDSLLYDRPTLEWLQAAPPSEQLWKKALFGNPSPFGANSQAWFFWPRRPRFVEELVARGVSTRSFDERSKRLVFYGKIENRVQERRRTTADWSTACDEFVMPKGDEKPYVFSQQEYLERLTDARFGLCLAGYGKKCHREVECMAMGCVPVVASEVDMSSYANPPEEGLHYLKAATPEEAKKLTEEVTPERWLIMSSACRTWWKQNCSVEGSWALTKKLLLNEST